MKKEKWNHFLCFVTAALILVLTFSGCSKSQNNNNNNLSSVTPTKTIVVKKSGTDKELTYQTRPVSQNRNMAYDEASDTTTITEGEAMVKLIGAWSDQELCYFSEKYGTVNLINLGKLVAVSDFINDSTSQTGWTVNGQNINLSITALNDSSICYNFHIHSENSTYQFFYTTNAETTNEDAAQLIAGVLNSFTFTK